MQDKKYMERALELARRGRPWPNPFVGAVVVKDGEIVGEGYHPKAGESHAEVYALAAAGERARGATLYVTLEPCCHTGRTPPCTEAILSAGVARVVVATADPNPCVCGRGLERLKQSGLEVEVGVLSQEARQQNEVFFHAMEKRRPHFTLKLAQSLDGKIATKTGASRWITGKRQGMIHSSGTAARPLWWEAALCGQMTLSSTRGCLKDTIPFGSSWTQKQAFLLRRDFGLWPLL